MLDPTFPSVHQTTSWDTSSSAGRGPPGHPIHVTHPGRPMHCTQPHPRNNSWELVYYKYMKRVGWVDFFFFPSNKFNGKANGYIYFLPFCCFLWCNSPSRRCCWCQYDGWLKGKEGEGEWWGGRGGWWGGRGGRQGRRGGMPHTS